jgi:hypothetical protein
MSVVIHFPQTDFLDSAPIGKPQGGVSCPPGFEDHAVCSDPFWKFYILLDSSTASEICVMTRSDWIGRVLSIELSRFYHGAICTLLALDRVAESSRPEITATVLTVASRYAVDSLG